MANTASMEATPQILTAPLLGADVEYDAIKLDLPRLFGLDDKLRAYTSPVKEWLVDAFPQLLSIRPTFGVLQPFWLLARRGEMPDPAEILVHMHEGLAAPIGRDENLHRLVQAAFGEAATQPGRFASVFPIASQDLSLLDLRSALAVLASRKLRAMTLPAAGGGVLRCIPIGSAFGPAQELWLWEPRLVDARTKPRRLLGRIRLLCPEPLLSGKIHLTVQLSVSTLVERPVSSDLPAKAYQLVQDIRSEHRCLSLGIERPWGGGAPRMASGRLGIIGRFVNGYEAPSLDTLQTEPAAALNISQAIGSFMVGAMDSRYAGQGGERVIQITGVDAREEGVLFRATADCLEPLGLRRLQAVRALAVPAPPSQVEEPDAPVESPYARLRTLHPDGFAVLILSDEGKPGTPQCAVLEAELRQNITEWSAEVYGDSDAIRLDTRDYSGIAALKGKNQQSLRDNFVADLSRLVSAARDKGMPLAVVAMTRQGPHEGMSRKDWIRQAANVARRPLQCVDPATFVRVGSVRDAKGIARIFKRNGRENELPEGKPDKWADVEKERVRIIAANLAHAETRGHKLAAIRWEIARQLGFAPELPERGSVDYERVMVILATSVRSHRPKDRKSGKLLVAVCLKRRACAKISTPMQPGWRPVWSRGLDLLPSTFDARLADEWLRKAVAELPGDGTLAVVAGRGERAVANARNTISNLGLDCATVDTDGLRMLGAIPGLLNESMPTGDYMAMEGSFVRKQTAPGLYPLGDGCFVSVAPLPSQAQRLAKVGTRRFVSSGGEERPEDFDARRAFRARGYLIGVKLARQGMDPADEMAAMQEIAHALHDMRIMAIPGGSEFAVLPGGAHYARKLVEWAGYDIEGKDAGDGPDEDPQEEEESPNLKRGVIIQLTLPLFAD